MNPKVTKKVIRRSALLVLCLATVIAVLMFSNRERQSWNHMQMIGINGQQIVSIWTGQSGNQKFARLLLALPSLAKARTADAKLMTPFQVHAASAAPCAAVKAAVLKVAQSSPSSVAQSQLECFMCFAEVVVMPCTIGCEQGGSFEEFFNTGQSNCHGVEFPDENACGGCEEFQQACFNDGCDGC